MRHAVQLDNPEDILELERIAIDNEFYWYGGNRHFNSPPDLLVIYFSPDGYMTTSLAPLNEYSLVHNIPKTKEEMIKLLKAYKLGLGLGRATNALHGCMGSFATGLDL